MHHDAARRTALILELEDREGPLVVGDVDSRPGLRHVFADTDRRRGSTGVFADESGGIGFGDRVAPAPLQGAKQVMLAQVVMQLGADD